MGLQDSYDLNYITTAIMMSDSEFTSILLESGHEDPVFAKFRHRKTFLYHAGGKDNVRRALSRLNSKARKNNTVGIIDSDFERLFPPRPPKPNHSNLFMTDTHDQETMVLASRALDCYLREKADDKDLMEFEKRTGRSVRDTIVDSAVTIGCLPYSGFLMPGGTDRSKHRALEGFDYTFNMRFLDNFDVWDRLVNPADLSIDVRQLCSLARQDNRNHDIEPEELLRLKGSIMPSDYWHVCNGHHLMHVLTIGMNKTFGRRRKEPRHFYSYGAVQADISHMYDLQMFSQTKLYKSMEEWQRSNKRNLLDAM